MSDRTPPGELKVGGQPRVQLLPVSVRAREKARGTRRRLVILVVFSMVVVGLGVAAAYLNERTARQALDAANSQTTALLAEQAKYAEATRLAQLVNLTEQAQKTVTGTEIQWYPLAVAIGEYVPSDVTWAGLAVDAPAPWEPTLVPEGPLRQPRVATVKLVFESVDFGSVAPFVENIHTLYGFSDVKILSTEFQDDLDVYRTTVLLTLTADAFSGRFASPDGSTN
ncbi:MAG: hypothetical protein ABIR17_06130 [Pseudolysinimonas sp.]|uniref:hypothetical protein n=1 Tax=Pseudolysinimonas sp. TaxID=2680009 RepID=UPI0032638C0D